MKAAIERAIETKHCPVCHGAIIGHQFTGLYSWRCKGITVQRHRIGYTITSGAMR